MEDPIDNRSLEIEKAHLISTTSVSTREICSEEYVSKNINIKETNLPDTGVIQTSEDVQQGGSNTTHLIDFKNIKVKSEPAWGYGQSSVTVSALDEADIQGETVDKNTLNMPPLYKENSSLDVNNSCKDIVTSLDNLNDRMVMSVNSELVNFMEHDNIEMSSDVNHGLSTIGYHATSYPNIGIIKSEPVWDDPETNNIHEDTIFEKPFADASDGDGMSQICNRKSDEFLIGIENSDDEFASHLMLNASSDPEWNSNMCNELKSPVKYHGGTDVMGITESSQKKRSVSVDSRQSTKSVKIKDVLGLKSSRKRKLNSCDSSDVEMKQNTSKRKRVSKKPQVKLNTENKEPHEMGGNIIKIIKAEPSWADDLGQWNVDKSGDLESSVTEFQEEGVNFSQFDFNGSQFENECAYPSAVFMNSSVTNETSLSKDLSEQTEDLNLAPPNIKIISVVDKKQNDDSTTENEAQNADTPNYVINTSGDGDNVLQINIFKVQTPSDQNDSRWSVKKEDNKFVKKDLAERMFECRECSKKFFEANELLTHFKSHEGGKANDAAKWNYPYICKKCHKGFTSSKGLLMHFQTHERLTACVESDKEDKQWNLQVMWQCPFCANEKFSTFLLLCQHMTTHKFNFCQFCKISFENNNDLQNHFAVKHNNKMSLLPSPDKPPTKSSYSRKDIHSINAYKCRHCQCLFINANALLKHERKHLKQPAQYRCSICEKIFTNKNHLTAHYNDDHKLKPSKISSGLPNYETLPASDINCDADESSNSVGMYGEASAEDNATLNIKTEPVDTDDYICDDSHQDQLIVESDNLSMDASEHDSASNNSSVTPQSVMFINTKKTAKTRTNISSAVTENLTGESRLRPNIADIVNNSISTVESESRGRGRRERKIYTCPICQKVFHTKPLFTSHLERHKDLSLDS